ncbi:MAG: hypothetical protein WCL07_03380 [bacterium]
MPGPESSNECIFNIPIALVGISSSGKNCDPSTELAYPGDPVLFWYSGAHGVLGIVSPYTICDSLDNTADKASCIGTSPIDVGGRMSLPLVMRDFRATGMIAGAKADNGTEWNISMAEASNIKLTPKANWDMYLYDHSFDISVCIIVAVSAIIGISAALKWMSGKSEKDISTETVTTPARPMDKYIVPARVFVPSRKAFAREVGVRLGRSTTLTSRNEFDNDSS